MHNNGVLETFLATAPGIITLSDIDYETFTQLRQAGRPALIKNGLRYFPGLQRLNPSFVVTRYGEKACNYSGDTRPVRNHEATNYKDFFDNKYDDKYTFTRKPFNPGKDNPFLEELTFPNPFFSKTDIAFLQLFAGKEGTAVLPHSHDDALNVMTYGKKRWILFDSTTPEGLQLEDYYYNKYAKDVQWSYWYEKEYTALRENFPIVEFIQESRDIVLVPKRYNHTVYNMDETIGVVVELR